MLIKYYINNIKKKSLNNVKCILHNLSMNESCKSLIKN